MLANEKNKQSVYFPDEMAEQLANEAARLDRSVSWLLQTAWRLSMKRIAEYPSPGDIPPVPALHWRRTG